MSEWTETAFYADETPGYLRREHLTLLGPDDPPLTVRERGPNEQDVIGLLMDYDRRVRFG